MDISILKQNIKDNKFDNFYIFVGDEWAIQKIYVEKISQVSGKQFKYIESIRDVYSSLVNPGFISQSYVYVIRDDSDIITNDKLQQQLSDGLLKNNILILILTQFDKRLKIFKTFEDKYVVFDKMPLKTLKKYVKSQINLSDDNIEWLIDICECDYGRILLEIDKIKQLSKFSDPDKLFQLLVRNGTIYIPPKDAVFDLVDAILKRQVKRSYELLQNCYDIGEANLIILNNLYAATKQLLQVQSCDSSDVMETCGITYPQMKAAESRKNKYSIGELIDALKLIRRVEKGIKIGEIEENISIEYVLINML